MNNKEKILNLIKTETSNGKKAMCTEEISSMLNMQRSNVSSALNELYKEGKLLKVKHKPVLYVLNTMVIFHNIRPVQKHNFDTLIGCDRSLKKCIQQAKAAILYPPMGLHTIIMGPTGVGKTLFAELMYKFAIENKVFDLNAPFEVFNCSDYANNSQLLLAHLFGCKKGAFTGADKDREGIVAKANGGILFLDEVHRLPPEGQEMLFYLIDRGLYTPLGSETKKESKLLIICATTENIDEMLLKTFTRRIPMNIKIPPLSERTLEERLELIYEFFRTECTRIKKTIFVSANSIRQLLLYDCPGNVGQLKSDIQLGCANAFLNAISNKLEDVEVHFTDFPSNVNQGLILYKNCSLKVDKLVKGDIRFYSIAGGQKNAIISDNYSPSYNIYEQIESEVKKLKDKGIENDEIKTIMEININNYFKGFIRNFEQKTGKEDLSKLVDEEIINIVEDFIEKAGVKLKKIFPMKVFYGLCLHVNSSITRIKNNKTIINYSLANIKKDYSREFEISKELASAIEKKYGISLPEDEIGFITMFLTIDSLGNENLENRPIVVIAMHGRATASSMAEVVNRLVGANNVYAYDMSLSKSSKTAYEELKNLIVNKHQGSGVLLLTDMGSLNIYGELINKDTGIEIRALDMVSTPIAIECSRKAIIESDINKIYEAVKYETYSYSPYGLKVSDSFIPDADNIIITLCTTGEGSAIKLKEFIESKIDISQYKIKVVPMALNNKEYMYNVISNLSMEKHIIAIVGTINPNIYGIPFISTYDIFMDKDCRKLKNVISSLKNECCETVQDKRDYSTFMEELKNDITNIDLSRFQKFYEEFVDKVHEKTGLDIPYEVSVGLMVHMACTISRLVSGGSIPPCCYKDMLKAKFIHEFNCIKDSVADIERFYCIEFNDDEISFILRNIIKL